MRLAIAVVWLTLGLYVVPANDSVTMCLRKRDVSPLFSGAHSLTEPFRSGCFPVRLW